MKIESQLLAEGLFGQIFTWMLEILPYLNSQGLQPEWCIRTKNYGAPPDHNIFPGIIRTNYSPLSDDEKSQSFEALKQVHMHAFKHDFKLASQLWNSFFSFTEEIIARSEEFSNRHFLGETVLGVHYRGADKNAAWSETNPVTSEEFLRVVQDFLETHDEFTAIFVATDDAHFLRAISTLKKVLSIPQPRSEDGRPLFKYHAASANQTFAKNAVMDSLVLSRCNYCLKCMSALSAFSKVINPELKTHRVSACKVDWFPEAYIPLYSSFNPGIRKLLRRLQQGDISGRSRFSFIDMKSRSINFARSVSHRRNR